MFKSERRRAAYFSSDRESQSFLEISCDSPAQTKVAKQSPSVAGWTALVWGGHQDLLRSVTYHLVREDGGRFSTAYASGMIAVNVGTLLTYYHLVMTNSLPWKIIMLLIGKWAIYTMAMLNNQRVIYVIFGMLCRGLDNIRRFCRNHMWILVKSPTIQSHLQGTDSVVRKMGWGCFDWAR